jgi:transposase
VVARAKTVKWSDEFYVTVYRLAKEGYSDNRIASALGVTVGRLRTWISQKPALAKGVEEARAAKEDAEGFRRYVFGKLSPELQDLWNRILKNEEDPFDEPGDARKKQRARRCLDEEVRASPQAERQQLYLYALVNGNFTRSEACRKVGISASCVYEWEQKDRQFKELTKQVEEAKKDFYESALVKLVRQGDTNAVVFANRTYNRDRGYNDKVEVNVSGNVTHSVDQLGLSLEVRKQILLAMRAKEAPALEDHSDVIECEVVK